MPVQQINVKNSSDIESWEGEGGRGTVRADSASCRTSCSNSSGDICRISTAGEAHNPLLAPVIVQWRLLEMSGVERRRLCCAVLFHCVAALCVMWSLFVLIERAVEEVNKGLIGKFPTALETWPFWTKLVVVAVGFTGGAVFMYIQCRQYLHLCNRWRAHNRILLIQNAPEKVPMSVASPILTRVRSKRAVGGCAGGAARGQVVANIEPPPPPAAFHEEDESGGFETYRGNPHRRLSALPPPDLHRVDERRYSDTRLAASESASAPTPHASQRLHAHAALVEEAAGPTSQATAGVYHISVLDPLEANIREVLALDARDNRTARSLPNLRASRESLLPAAAPRAHPHPS
ncbi:E3 ubiquitin-protein ligase MARCH8 [Eumeta japonica]|uniref:E3 ubiquitin-protein ligase MARCH8 n=1 Tax=Eumeta variegata TaxID=151549 RepID=A0A4C1XYP4_EUMVA|nr:E3 ubiquitin-protein ligase MARCH8 [Eumeta japonica]